LFCGGGGFFRYTIFLTKLNQKSLRFADDVAWMDSLSWGAERGMAEMNHNNDTSSILQSMKQPVAPRYDRMLFFSFVFFFRGQKIGIVRDLMCDESGLNQISILEIELVEFSSHWTKPFLHN
jgi:hypothetical protein